MNENNYKKMLEYFRARKKAANVLIWQNRIITSVFYIMYPVLLIMQIVKRQQWFFTAVTAGVSFVVVSVFRYLYNKPRPYEVYNEKPLINKTTKGKSFPSTGSLPAGNIATVPPSSSTPADSAMNPNLKLFLSTSIPPI